MIAARFAANGLRQGLAPKLSHRLVCRSQGYATGSGKDSIKRLRTRVETGTPARTGEAAISMGQGLVAGAAVLGMGGLCYYGLGLSPESGAIDKVAFWPDIVKQRIKTTYGYFGSSLAITAASAVAASRTPAIMNLMSRGGWLPMIGCIAAMWGSGMYCQSVPYQEGFGHKQIAWMLHTAVVGAVLAPMAMIGGPILIRAAVYTAGMVGGLSTVALCAPSEKFLNMGGPLAMGLGVVFMSSIGTAFLPPTSALGVGLYSIAMYGGLVLFGAFMLYDTQKIIKRAETTPVYSDHPYDPINNSIGIYLNTINIFVRLASLLAGGGGRRK